MNLIGRGICLPLDSCFFSKVDTKICDDDNLFEWDRELNIHCLPLGEISLKLEFW